jgi:peptide/nickel transport system substrate-binding protein
VRRSEFAAGAAALATAAPAAVRAQPRKRHPYTIPHTLRYATGSEPRNLNPLLTQDFVAFLLASLTMAWLVRYDHQNRPVPELAIVVPTERNRLISGDGKSITFKLRRGVVWSDGMPFTAKDLVFTWKCVMDSRNDITSRLGWDDIYRIDTPDDYTAIFRLQRPYGGFLPTFFGSGGANPCILPAHLFKDTQINEAPYNALPVGIGPFKYVRWRRGSEVELVANDRYWRGKPKLQRIISKLITDENTVLTQIESHELDLWVAAQSTYWSRLQQISGVKAIKRVSGFFDHVDFNVANPILKEHAVREALRYGIDRETINRTIYHDVGIVQEAMFSPVYPISDSTIPLVPYDPRRANELLDGAGWKMGPGGVRMKNGQRLSLEIVTTSGVPDRDATIELIQSWWKQIGVNLSVLHYAAPMLFATYGDHGILQRGKYEISLFSWLPPPTGNLANLYSSKYIPPNGQNSLRYSNPKVDAWCHVFNETYDVERRKKLASQIMRQIIADVPTIVLRIREDIYAYNDDLVGFNPNAQTPFDWMMEVDI